MDIRRRVSAVRKIANRFYYTISPPLQTTDRGTAFL